MNADGSDRTPLIEDVGTAQPFIPAWSPDGTKIAFPSNRDGNHEIYLINVDGSGLTNLTNNPAEDFWPSWSAAG